MAEVREHNGAQLGVIMFGPLKTFRNLHLLLANLSQFGIKVHSESFNSWSRFIKSSVILRFKSLKFPFLYNNVIYNRFPSYFLIRLTKRGWSCVFCWPPPFKLVLVQLSEVLVESWQGRTLSFFFFFIRGCFFSPSHQRLSCHGLP